MLKKITATILLMLVILGTTLTASASGETYIKVDVPGDITEQRLSKEMYYPVAEINAETFGLKQNFKGITDLFYNDVSEILLLCGDFSKLYRINKTYDKVKEIKVVDKKGAAIDYSGAEGVYADNKGNIYISDTKNSRILILDKNGKLIETIEAPVSDLLPKDFYFQPTTVARDQHDYIYVLSLGCYYGALVFDPNYEFMGFYGPNTVQATGLDVLSYLWDRLTSTEEKENYSTKELPYSFSDFSFDNDGYMVTCTSAVSNNQYSSEIEYGQIKKITHNGSNILYKRNLYGTTFPSSEVNFLETSFVYGAAGQSLDSIITDDDGYIYALEVGHGKIYVYDSECNLMSAFGGGIQSGNQLGIFDKPVAIALNGHDIIVADFDSCSITVFEPTEYGLLIKEAQALYLKGDYDASAELWEEILSENRNCQLAYRGLAMVYYNQGKLHESLEMAEIACDYSVYDLAWKKIVSQFVADNFLIIIAILVAVAVAIYFLFRYLRKRDKKLINNRELKLLFNAPFHPFNTFDDLKYKKMGSWKIAIVLTVLFYVASVLNVTSTGFLYSKTLLRNYNSLYTLFATIGLIILWSICNFLVCSMFDGKGTLKEVYISTTYCLMPWTIFLFLKVVLTNFLPLATSGLVVGLETVVLIYTFFMLAIAMIKIHEFDFFKFLLTSIGVVFLMLLVVFVILMCGILAEQFISFLAEIYDEVVHR